MKKLTKEEQQQFEVLQEGYGEAHQALRDAVEAYNAKLEELREFGQGVVDRIQEYIDERSDKWREGDRAGEYEDWVCEWIEFVDSRCEDIEIGRAHV